MADYKFINEKDKITVKCYCGEEISFRVGDTITNATRCKNGHIILKSSKYVQAELEKYRKRNS